MTAKKKAADDDTVKVKGDEDTVTDNRGEKAGVPATQDEDESFPTYDFENDNG